MLAAGPDGVAEVATTEAVTTETWAGTWEASGELSTIGASY